MLERHRRSLVVCALLAGGIATGVSLQGVQGPPVPAPASPQAPAPPRDPRANEPALAVGKGSITGTVIVAGSGQPARRARVSLSASGEGGGSRTTTSDDAGQFTFSALPEGRFSLSASKQGYLGGSYGQKRPGRPGTPIQLADGQRLQAALQIWRGGVITGMVVDEHAEAIPGTPVRALRYVTQSGVRTLQSAGNGQTDDRGVYRIFGLQPGDYLVFATPRNNNGAENFDRMRAELQAIASRPEVAGVAERGEATAALMERFNTLRASLDAAEEPSSGYAPVYYPGTTSPAGATSISVGAGDEKSGIDFQYQVVPIARIEGMVTSAASVMPPNVQVSLVNTGFDVPGINPGSTRVDAQGSFRISNVPPGQYTLIARATINAGREGGPAGRGFTPGAGGRGELAMGRGRGGPGSQATRLWATTDVTIDGRNVTNVLMTLQQGLSVSGRVVFEGATQQTPTDFTRMRVSLIPMVLPGTPGELSASAAGTVEADGRFTIASVFPGRYRLSASVGGGNTGWFLGATSLEGQESLDFPVEIKPGQAISNATITFVDRQSELGGLITNEQSQPVADYSVIVFPSDSRYWQPQSRRIQTARPATDGRFTFRNLPSGEYRLAPVMDPEPGSWFDPSFLQQLEGIATRVTLADGEKKEQSLRVPGGV